MKTETQSECTVHFLPMSYRCVILKKHAKIQKTAKKQCKRLIEEHIEEISNC